MQYYRCKCGSKVCWGSMSPAPCEGCEKCGTTLDLKPEFHTKPREHSWVTEYNKKTGEKYEICENCGKILD